MISVSFRRSSLRARMNPGSTSGYFMLPLVKFGLFDGHIVGGHSINGVGTIVPIIVVLEKFEHLFDGGPFHCGG